MGKRKDVLKIGDIVYAYKNEHFLYTISDMEVHNGKRYCLLKNDPEGRIGEWIHERFVHPATDEKAIEAYKRRISPEYKEKMIRAQEESEKWLTGRQQELKGLSFRVFEGTLFKEEKEVLREAGYFCYDLRDWDEGDGFNIEKSVIVNNIGNWVTDMDLTPFMNEGSWIGIDELKLSKTDELPYEEIKGLLEKGKNLHSGKEKPGLDEKIEQASKTTTKGSVGDKAETIGTVHRDM